MKKLSFFSVIIFFISATITIADIKWDFGDYSFHIPKQPQVTKNEGKMMSFITASLQKNPEGKIIDEFGIIFNPEESDTFWVYEIYDVEADQIVKRITINEMLGLTREQGCELITNEQPDEETIITRFKVDHNGYVLTLTRIIKLIEDGNLPAGSKVVISFEIKNHLSGELKLRFTERHRNDDYAFSEDDNVLYTVNKHEEHDGFPILVQVYKPEIQTVSFYGTPEENDLTVSSAKWKPITVKKSTSTQPNIEIGRIEIAVANTKNVSYTQKQAKNIANYLDTGSPKPQLAVDVEVDKKEAYPGDILTYQLICLNIGTGKAIDGSILDPLPESVEYIPGTASGEKTEISYSMDGGETFQPKPEGNVTHIKWEVVEPIQAGESIHASFQAKVRE